MEIRPSITTIPPLENTGFPNREFELRLTKGPLSIGQPGEGTYAELYSRDYLVFLDETGRLRVYVSTGSAWVPVDEALYPQPPHPGDQIRHIGACFDQAARLVLAYEFNQQVYVYQWNQVNQQYTTRGPFPGVDPVIIQDATIGFYPPDSDALLLHLSTDRTRLIMRVQRELYNTEHEVAVLPRPALLDQVSAFPFYGQVVGSYVDSPDNTGFVVRTDTYPFPPVYLYEQAGEASMTAPTQWMLIPIVIIRDVGMELAASGNVSPPATWEYISLVVTKSWDEVAGSSTASPPVAWDYIPIVVTKNLSTEVAGSSSVAAPTAWNYPLVVVVKDAGTEVAGSVSVGAPAQWNYLLVVMVYNGSVDVAASASVAAPVQWNYYV